MDPSFNRAAGTSFNNLFGSAGAYIADPLLQGFGIAVFVPILVFFTWSIRSYFSNPPLHLWMRSIAMLIALLSTCALSSSFQTTESWPFYVGYGGFFGDLIQTNLTPDLLSKAWLIFLSTLISLIFLFPALALKWQEIATSLKTIYQLLVLLTKALKVSYYFIKRIAQYTRWKKSSSDDKEYDVSLSDDYAIASFNGEKPSRVEPRASKPKKASKALQPSLKLDSSAYEAPELMLLSQAKPSEKKKENAASLEQNARLLEKVLDDFGVRGDIVKVRPGPVVTLYELEPAAGTKSSRVIGLADDIARSMSAISTRIAVIPGRNAIGVELPNSSRETVYLRELLETEEYRDERIKLPIALGKDIGGDTVITDLSRMPHLLIAGTTGSGKSVGINTMILSFLYRLSPEECKMIMIDPKMLELSVYEGIPHLLSPVVTEPGKAVVALKWAVKEMEHRYRLMSNLGVRNIAGYNKRIEEAVQKGEVLERSAQTGFDPNTGKPIVETIPLEMEKLPFIVIVVDEMADLMLVAGKDIEGSIQRLAQMARAAGIHLIMATQRPSVDVITGVIKANFPTRISFQVTSRIDSRTILGEQGAEQLLGMGDMLYMAGGSRVIRVHGAFVDDNEVIDVVAHLKRQGKPHYLEEITKEEDDDSASFDAMNGTGSGDDLYDQAVAIVIRDKKASTSYIQRQLRIGYNRAADIIDKMEAEGVVSAPNHVGKREILVLND
jgi:S-DNA-T family DNA segregation ATPase FtsK/SpoIIIE